MNIFMCTIGNYYKKKKNRLEIMSETMGLWEKLFLCPSGHKREAKQSCSNCSNIEKEIFWGNVFLIYNDTKIFIK